MMIIDRIEEETVVVDCDGEIKTFEITKFALPIREGDVVTQKGGVFIADIIATEKRRREIIEKMKKLGLK